jgi:hypothetical protein
MWHVQYLWRQVMGKWEKEEYRNNQKGLGNSINSILINCILKNNKPFKSSENYPSTQCTGWIFKKMFISWDCPVKGSFFYLDVVTVPEQPNLEVAVQLVHGSVCRSEYRKLAYKIQAYLKSLSHEARLCVTVPCTTAAEENGNFFEKL